MIFDRLASGARHPAQLVVGSFVSLILVGTLLLQLPFAVDAGTAHPGVKDTLFWSTSAATVTGLGTVDISVFSLFGELVLLGLIQVGGFGIMTIGSVLAIVASNRVGLRQRMLAQTEIGAVDIGELRTLISAIAKITVGVELSISAILFVRMLADGPTTAGRAAYVSIFHGVSAFNNAGISLYSDSLTQFAADPFVVFPITAAFIIGGLGFPILVEFQRRARPRDWSLHTRITLVATAVLVATGPLVVLTFEWTNADTIGTMSVWEKVQAAWFQGVTPRTAGFNTIDIGALREPTTDVITALMFIGAGPASTSGGIKVTTFAVLGFAMWSEIRSSRDVNAFGRRLPDTVIRQAMTVALLSVGTVFAAATTLTAVSTASLSDALFEAASAFGTVGLSTGITATLPDAGQFVLILLMLAGRVGPITFITALALKRETRAYRFAEERPIIG